LQQVFDFFSFKLYFLLISAGSHTRNVMFFLNFLENKPGVFLGGGFQCCTDCIFYALWMYVGARAMCRGWQVVLARCLLHASVCSERDIVLRERALYTNWPVYDKKGIFYVPLREWQGYVSNARTLFLTSVYVKANPKCSSKILFRASFCVQTVTFNLPDIYNIFVQFF